MVKMLNEFELHFPAGGVPKGFA